MKPTKPNRFVSLSSVIALGLAANASAADLYWDANGATAGTGGLGTWSTADTWRDGSSTGTLGSWADGNSAIFGGTTATVTVSSAVTVNQLKFLTTGYTIGAVGSGPLFFGGSYSDLAPTIDTTGITPVAANRSTTISSKITGTLTGGLVIRDVNNITTPGTAGRLYLNKDSASDFSGDITVLSGNLHALSNLGDAANKVILKGGALFGSSSSAITYQIARSIDVAANSAIGLNATATGVHMELASGKTITGTFNLTRYATGGQAAVSELRLLGDMSGYTGTFENTGGVAVIQTTATSGGAWKLTGGTLILNTTDNTHIADGAGKSALLMNGSTLDMNGKSETINGLSGATGIVQNQAAATASVLTVGSGDATASFGGTVRDNSVTGGTLALTKTGTGIQTLGGFCSYTGATTVNAGTLVLGGTMNFSPITVNNGATFQVSGVGKDVNSLAQADGSRLVAPIDQTGVDYLGVTNAIDFSGGTVTIVPTFTGVPSLNVPYDVAVASLGVSGSATLVADFSANGAARVSGTANYTGTAIQVTITQLGANLIWDNVGNTGTGIWNLDGDANFLNGASNDVFKTFDTVTFGAGSPAGIITLAGTLLPTEVVVDSPNSFTFAGSGSLSGGILLTKRGSGILTVSNNNSVTGVTHVEEGVLVVDGALGTGATIVDPGTTLAGSGSLAGTVTVDGAIAPGNGIGTLSTGALTLNGTYKCDIDGSQSDNLNVTGNLNLAGATLDVNFINPATGMNHVIATYTGSLSGTFAAVPSGYELDYSVPGKVVLWPVTIPAAGTITFEADQSYPAAPGELAAVTADPNGASYAGTQGWSLSTSSNAAWVQTAGSSGEYRGGQTVGANSTGTYVGGKLGSVQHTGANTITFDAPYNTGTSVGFMKDSDADGLFDAADTGMAFGIGGAPGRFQSRDTAFGPENFGTGFSGADGQWHRFAITIGASSGGSRSITMAVRNLTTGIDFDFDGVTPGTQNWTFTVTDAQFGPAPELADGVFIRTTASARIDNLRVTSVEPPVGTPFDLWMADFTTLIGNAKLAGADPDHDGATNLMEFVLNGDPGVSDSGNLLQQSIVGDDLRLTFRRRNDSEAFASLQLQVGEDLSGWPTTATIGAGDGSSGDISWTVTPDGANLDLITITIPKGVDPAKFVRLKAETLAP